MTVDQWIIVLLLVISLINVLCIGLLQGRVRDLEKKVKGRDADGG
jgi:hypothetical protein